MSLFKLEQIVYIRRIPVEGHIVGTMPSLEMLVNLMTHHEREREKEMACQPVLIMLGPTNRLSTDLGKEECVTK